MIDQLTVNYSVGTTFNGGGIGYTAYNAALASYQKKWLHHLFASSANPSEIPADLITTMGIRGELLRKLPRYFGSVGYRWHDEAFDRFVAERLDDATIFHGWNQHSLYSLKAAKKRGSRLVLERASSHLLTAKQILEEEYRRFGVKAPVIDPISLETGLAEFDETDYVLVPSQFAYQSFLEQGYPKEKLHLLPFGVDVVTFQPQPKTTGVFTFLFVGQVGLRKGIPYLLEAWEQFRNEPVRLVLAGAVQSDLQAYLQAYPIARNISVGFVENIKEAYSQADVFVFPSLEEGMALVTLEAMASGLPVITTPNAGSIVTDGEDGFVVPIRDAVALAATMKLLYQDRKLSEKVGRAASRSAQEYTWEKYRQGLTTFYQLIAT